MKKILKWVSLLFAVSVSIFVIFLFYTISGDEPIEKPKPFTYEPYKDAQNDETLWLNHLSKTKYKGYYFPVDEVYIKTDLIERKDNKPIYKLEVNDLDPYQIFCLNQELKRHEIRFFFKKEKHNTKLFVLSSDKKKLNDLVKVLKNYQIEATITR
jgi:hypothetical protein